MNVFRSRTFLVALIALSAFLFGCKKPAAGPSDTRKVLGTDVTITIYDQGRTPEELKALFDEQFALMADWEKRALAPGADNQVYRLSQGAGEQSVTADADVFQMLMKAIRFYDNSNGVFDVRYGPMLDAWGFDSRPHAAGAQQLDTLKAYVTDGGMFVAGNGILLAKKGMRFDAREIVEGYVFDLVAGKLGEKGVKSAAVYSPYVWRFIGEPPDKRGFPVALGHPVTADSGYALVWSPTGGLALAAASKDRFQANGKFYHSLLDPRTGMPANKLLGAIVHSADAASAQAMAYSVFVHGTVDSLDANGKNLVTGSAVISGTPEAPNLQATGSLADRIEVGK